ncbi:phage portal protein [Aerococcaceae bacterium NML190073]|nr:phage portal protein [Aerococcaceae bacterium NML190073]
MWEALKQFGRKVGVALGIIKHLNSVQDHKKINVSEKAYSDIERNKDMYAGYVKDWHDLEYLGTNGNTIKRKQMSLGMPKILAREFAMLVFNEGVQIGLAEESQAQWELISDTISSNKFKREFQRYLEYMFAMGGLAVEVYLDGDVPKVAYATADAFFPISQDAEQVDEAVIANKFKKNGNTYTLLKWHEWKNGKYIITNELYESKNNSDIGYKVPLKTLFPDLQEEVMFDNLECPLFVYFKPNEANNKDVTSPLGVGVFDNSRDTMRMLDVMYDFWYNEFRLGKRRVAVPQYLVKAGFDRNGNQFMYFDDSEELFVAMNSGEQDGMEIKDLSVEIRSEQVVQSINALLDILSMQVGLSTGSFTFTGTGLKTATQVVSENSKTYRTRQSHLNIIEDGLRDLIIAVYQVANIASQSQLPPLEREEISIDFNDGVFTDKQAELDYYLKLYKAGAIPLKRMLIKVHGLSEQEAQDYIDEINAEKAQADVATQEAIASVQLGGVIE